MTVFWNLNVSVIFIRLYFSKALHPCKKKKKKKGLFIYYRKKFIKKYITKSIRHNTYNNESKLGLILTNSSTGFSQLLNFFCNGSCSLWPRKRGCSRWIGPPPPRLLLHLGLAWCRREGAAGRPPRPLYPCRPRCHTRPRVRPRVRPPLGCRHGLIIYIDTKAFVSFFLK